MIKYFWCGFLLNSSIMGIYQDWMGLEGYINYLRHNWIDLPWWIWLFPIGIILVILGKNGFFNEERD